MKKLGLILTALVIGAGLMFTGCPNNDDSNNDGINWSLTANGTSGSVVTTLVTLKFDENPSGLKFEDISLDSGTTAKATITGNDFASSDGKERVISVNVTRAGKLLLTIDKSGFVKGPKDVQVHHDNVFTSNISFPSATSSAPGNGGYAIERVMPTNRTQAQMNQDVIDQFAKLIPEFLVDYETSRSDTMNDPETFRMILSMWGGTGPGVVSAVTTTETHGYGMMILAYMAGCEEEVVSAGITTVKPHTNDTSTSAYAIGGKKIKDILKECLPDSLRTAWGTNDVTVKDYFDAMCRTARHFPSNGNGGGNSGTFMAWSLNSGTVAADRTRPLSKPLSLNSQPSSATDGDLDMAYALLLAEKQWGSDEGTPGLTGTYGNYGTFARAMINNIFLHDVDRGQHANTTPARYHMLIGNWAHWNAADSVKTRPSDFMLQHLRSFAAVDNTQVNSTNRWQLVINATMKGMEQIYALNNPRSGVLPDFVVVERATGNWTRVDGLVHEVAGTDGNHGPNSCRVPWRLGLDALHNNDIPAVKTLHDNGLKILYERLITRSGGGDGNWNNIGQLNFDGSSRGSTGNMYASPAMVAASVYGTPAQMTNGWNYARSQSVTSGRGYGAYINMLSMIAASGNWWAPETK